MPSEDIHHDTPLSSTARRSSRPHPMLPHRRLARGAKGMTSQELRKPMQDLEPDLVTPVRFCLGHLLVSRQLEETASVSSLAAFAVKDP